MPDISIDENDLSPAVAHGWQIMDSLDPDVKAQLDAYLEGADVPRD